MILLPAVAQLPYATIVKEQIMMAALNERRNA